MADSQVGFLQKARGGLHAVIDQILLGRNALFLFKQIAEIGAGKSEIRRHAGDGNGIADVIVNKIGHAIGKRPGRQPPLVFLARQVADASQQLALYAQGVGLPVDFAFDIVQLAQHAAEKFQTARIVHHGVFQTKAGGFH